jgi:hypothetical protein
VIKFYVLLFIAALGAIIFVLRRISESSQFEDYSKPEPKRLDPVFNEIPLNHKSHELESKQINPLDYLLSTHPSSYYLNQFDESRIKFVPHRIAGFYAFVDDEFVRVESDDPSSCYKQEQSEHGIISICTDFGSLEIRIPCNDSKIDSELISITKHVLENIVEMDTGPLSSPSSLDYKGYLGEIHVNYEKIEFRYYSATINTEWERFFTKTNGIWVESV